MAESQSLCNKLTHQFYSDSDVAAAQQLMQLSDEDNNSNCSSSNSDNNNKKINKSNYKNCDGKFMNRSQGEIAWLKIAEIFGEEEEISRPKRRRYRSLDSIYEATKPMKVGRV